MQRHRHRQARAAAWAALLICAAPAPGLSAGSGPQGAAKTAAPLETTQPAAARPWARYKVDPAGISSWPQADWGRFSDLAHPHLTPPGAETLHHSGPIEGDAGRGKRLAFDRSRGGSCVSCHVLGKDTPAQPGNVGPDLSAIGAHRSDQQLFDIVYDARVVNRDTIMPPWGAHGIFNAAEIKDIVAFLKTLQTPYRFTDRSEDPATRPPPVDKRDNLDATENPAMFVLDAGKRAYQRAGPTGKSCADCHGAAEQRFKSWAATLPRFEPRLGKVLGVEEFVTRHARATTGENLLMETEDNVGLSIYLRNLANGRPMRPDVSSPGAKQALQRGNALLRAKLGQLDMACVDCHVTHSGKWARGQLLVRFKGTVAHFPTWRTSRADVWDIRKRFQWCNVSVRANELPPDAPEYGDIELALALINQGEKLNSPGIRH
ncbi:MAG TPA: sulfur oxidation c-type cytochrome SoxA [Burkholderiales bacterium]|nr:sulfur oxidation c-type cytochrome SoxA [Burkholderiales bacterium]